MSKTVGVPARSAAAPLDLICLGEAMIEFNQDRRHPTRYTAGFGGDSSNCAIAAARMTPDDAAFAPCLQQVARARTLHVTGISQAISAGACATVFAAIERARAAGARVAYDLNFRPKLWSVDAARPVVQRTVAMCD